jgi:hypothetical protein
MIRPFPDCILVPRVIDEQGEGVLLCSASGVFSPGSSAPRRFRSSMTTADLGSTDDGVSLEPAHPTSSGVLEERIRIESC